MSNKSIRLSSLLTFDEQRESDMIKFVNEKQDSHEIGQFLSNLIRIAFDNEEILTKLSDETGTKYVPGTVLNQIKQCGITQKREEFVDSVSSQVADIKKKVDSIYDMAYKLYITSLAGNHLGLGKQAENLMMSCFLIERQTKALEDTVGTKFSNHVYLSNRLQDTKENAEQVLECMLQSYGSILNEFQNSICVQQVQQAQPVQVAQAPQVQQQATVQQPQSITQQHQAQVEQQKVEAAETDDNGDSIVDFGCASIEELSAFFGE